ncbi:LAME_0F12530g1_1 [Lachancea meyersii CBS 8951]|uniref:LAME_0F12530g1_1 n=1 Tax=Lachancea meyersii CBS 8951 TaxID=1266667 RepID=A0A1G4JWY4_9SACH|nr:LAME_0F12530g1_1 [Lachancea meyersii CBS 8951]
MAPRESMLNDWTINVQKPCSDEGNVRTRPAKLVSVSSMLGSVPPGSMSGSKWRQEAHDLFGLKRLAKAYFKSGQSYTKEDISGDHTIHYRVKPANSNLHGAHPLSGTMIKVGNRLPQKRQKYSVSMESFADHGPKNVTIRKARYFETDGTGLAPLNALDSKSSRGANINDWSFSNNNDFEMGTVNPSVLSAESNKVLQLCNLPKNCGLQSVLSQVAGGPLERVDVIIDPYDLSAITAVRLEFISAQCAQSFMRHGQARNLQINGHVLKPEWAPRLRSDHLNMSVVTGEEQMHDKVLNKKCDGSTPRRCIIIKKTGHKEHLRSRQMVSRKLCHFDVAELKRDFADFGEIAEVTPMISRKLCVSISYFDIRSAIDVMASYENPNTYMNKKYSREWSINYGRDTTERPCYMMV